MTVLHRAQLTKYRAAFQQPGARTVQKQARQGSQSDVRQEFSKPKDYQMPRAINEVSRSKDSRNFKLSRLHRADCSKASETRQISGVERVAIKTLLFSAITPGLVKSKLCKARKRTEVGV